MLRDEPGFYLTNLHSWTNGNAIYGSFREMRFLVRPTVLRDKASGQLLPDSRVETFVWRGEYCLEESEVLATAEFPLTEEGRDQVLDWLDAQYRAIAAGGEEKKE